MSKTIFILNGPNLNLLGKRQPEIYGADTLEDVETRCRALAESLGFRVECYQSNHEGAIIDTIHLAREEACAIVINPGAFTHTSVAILDALNAYDGLVFECHISNVHKREPFRHHSFVSGRADGVMAGFGTEGYELCVRRACSILSK